jgi:hypothetical protein
MTRVGRRRGTGGEARPGVPAEGASAPIPAGRTALRGIPPRTVPAAADGPPTGRPPQGLPRLKGTRPGWRCT